MVAAAVLAASAATASARGPARQRPQPPVSEVKWYRLTVGYHGDLYTIEEWFGGSMEREGGFYITTRVDYDEATWWTARTPQGVLVQFYPRSRTWVAHNVRLVGSISRATTGHYTQSTAHDYLAGTGTRRCYNLAAGKIVHGPQIGGHGRGSPDFTTEPFDLISTDDNDALWLTEHLFGTTTRAREQVTIAGDEENCLGTPQHSPEPQVTDFSGDMPIQPNFIPADLKENRRSAQPPLFERTGPTRFGARQVELKSSYSYDVLPSVDPIPDAQGLFPDMTSRSASGHESFTFRFTLCRRQSKRCDP